MNPIPPQTVLDALQWRYATKQFNPARIIPAPTWEILEQALVLSPSSFGLQPWKFLVITDPATRQRLVPISWGQTQPVDCSHFVVLTVRLGMDDGHVDRFIQRIVEVRGGSVEALAGYRNMMAGSLEKARSAGSLDTWQTHQVYIALGQFMASAALMGVDTCPMEGIEPGQYDQALGLSGSGFTTVVACAAGYRADEDRYARLKKVRFERSEVVQRI